jgi:hypothetical protein
MILIIKCALLIIILGFIIAVPLCSIYNLAQKVLKGRE